MKIFDHQTRTLHGDAVEHHNRNIMGGLSLVVDLNVAWIGKMFRSRPKVQSIRTNGQQMRLGGSRDMSC